jgi:signal transduction histidine kinase
MARRIVLAVLALVAALLGVVVVPLGVITANQDRRDFQDETVLAARTVANLAEERLDDHEREPQLGVLIRQLDRDGDRVGAYNLAGREIAGTATPPLTPPDLAQARTAERETVFQPDGWYSIAVPVASDSGGGRVGAVVLTRPSSAVDREADVLWGLIAAIGAAGLVAAVLIAVALARWVRRPLSELERAAQALGDGALETRSPIGRGPAEIQRLAGNFNLMAARLEALVRGHQATMADVSHQLRSPLAALRLRLELLAEDSDDAAAAELAGAQDEISRLSRLVNGLLAIARAENIDTPQVNQRVDHVISTRVAAWRPAADERSVRLETDLQPAVARIREGHLEQILDNLIANALDAMQQGGAVRLTAAAVPAGGPIRITVADNGPGMTKQQQERAFRRFTTGYGGGVGLGLAIVNRLAVASGGTATLSDTQGGGLTVTIELPPARSERSRGSAHLQRSQTQGSGSAAGGG